MKTVPESSNLPVGTASNSAPLESNPDLQILRLPKSGSLKKYLELVRTGTEMKVTIIDTFLTLAAKAKEACETRLSTRDFEAEFREVLEYVERHPEERAEFTRLFIAMLKDPEFGCWELIEFCMHQLRWEDVRLTALDWLKANGDFRVKSVMSDIAGAFSDDWKNADLYTFYSRRP